jgi:hypothetical protein
LLCEIGRFLVKENSLDSIHDRAVLASMFQACGRPSETSNLCVEFLTFDSTDQTIYNDWPETKTGTSVHMPFYPMNPNRLGRHLAYGGCFYNAIAGYLATAGNLKSSQKEDGQDGPVFFFSKLATIAENSVAKKYTNLLHRLSKATVTVGKEVFSIPELTPDMTAYDIRHGAADQMSLNRHCVIMAIVARGDWDWKGDCLAFGYVTKKLYLSLGGKALADVDICSQLVTPPLLRTVYAHADFSDDLKSKIRFMVILIFENCPEYFHDGLAAWRDSLAANLFMYYESVEADQPLSIILQKIIQCGERARIGTTREVVKVVKLMGDLIWDDYISTNNENERKVDGTAQMKVLDELAEEFKKQQILVNESLSKIALNNDFLRIAVENCQSRVELVCNSIQNIDQDVFDILELNKTVHAIMKIQREQTDYERRRANERDQEATRAYSRLEARMKTQREDSDYIKKLLNILVERSGGFPEGGLFGPNFEYGMGHDYVLDANIMQQNVGDAVGDARKMKKDAANAQFDLQSQNYENELVQRLGSQLKLVSKTAATTPAQRDSGPYGPFLPPTLTKESLYEYDGIFRPLLPLTEESDHNKKDPEGVSPTKQAGRSEPRKELFVSQSPSTSAAKSPSSFAAESPSTSAAKSPSTSAVNRASEQAVSASTSAAKSPSTSAVNRVSEQAVSASNENTVNENTASGTVPTQRTSSTNKNGRLTGYYPLKSSKKTTNAKKTTPCAPSDGPSTSAAIHQPSIFTSNPTKNYLYMALKQMNLLKADPTDNKTWSVPGVPDNSKTFNKMKTAYMYAMAFATSAEKVILHAEPLTLNEDNNNHEEYLEFTGKLESTAAKIADKTFAGLRSGFQGIDLPWGKKRPACGKAMTLGSVYSCLSTLANKLERTPIQMIGDQQAATAAIYWEQPYL